MRVTSSHPFAENVLAELQAQFPMLARAAQRASGTAFGTRLPMLEAIARRIDEVSTEPWIAASVKAYVMLCLEFLKLQRELERTGRYLLSTEREAFEKVYNNGNVFGFYYLAGLLLSQALWPNHYGLSTSFAETFVPSLVSRPQVLEVGVGSGFHLRALSERVAGLRYDGVDLSPYAIEFARRYAYGADTPEQIRFHNRSATGGLPFADGQFTTAVCGEVLEHVEDPGALLKEIRRVCRADASFFMTTAIFAANIDHIYLFEDAQQVRTLVCRSGWTVEREWVYPLYHNDPEKPRCPASYGAILRP